jgi:hypothetical protein
MKYYTVRLLAALFVMGSFGGGFLAGDEYGKWIGWVVFIIMMLIGVKLHYVAEKIDKHHK